MNAQVVPLGDVAEFIRGVTYKPADLVKNFSQDSIVCMRTANVQKALDESDLLSIPRALIKKNEKVLREGDLLVSTANSWNLVGKCCWVPALNYPATAGGFIAILRANSSEIDPRYLYHWFSSPDTQADARNCGRQTTNISNMDINRCLELKVPLPPLPEQRRIAAILDKADALRAKRREAIAKLDQLPLAIFQEMFADIAISETMLSIEDVIERIVDYRGKTPAKTSSGIPLITAKLIKGMRVSSPSEYIAEENYFAWMTRGIPSPSCVLITTEAPMGEVALMPSYKAALAQRLLSLEPKKGVLNPTFLMWTLVTPLIKDQLKKFSTGSTVTGIRQKEFRKVLIPVPSIDKQEKFSSLANSVLAQKERYETMLLKIEAMFGSLQERAFSGHL